MEKIKHAAVKSKEGWIFIGKCHADCFHKAYNIKVKMSGKACDQGFVTSLGRYVERPEAAEIAKKAEQISGEDNILFSELLWSPTDCGIHQYCDIEGYELL